MSKLKIKNLLRLIGSLVLVVLLALTFVACNENPGDDGANGSETTEIITPVRNGEFIYFDDSTNPYSPSSWTLSSEYDVDDDDDSVYVISGVIDTTSDGFSKNKGSYGISKNPGKVGDDDNVLMINNVKPYSAKYKSTAITLEAGKFYKLTLSVKTDQLTAENGGANVSVTSSGSREYLAFKSIKGETWTQYNFFLEAKKTEKTTVYVSLSLGEGDEGDDATLAKGVAFFDSVVLTAYTNSDTLTAEEQYDKDSQPSTNADWNEDTHATYDFSLPNREFDNKNVLSSTSSTSSPYDWSTKYGTDENGDFKAPTTGLTRGVIDVTKYVPTKGILKDNVGNSEYAITKPAESKGDNVLMIYFTDPKSPSAFAYTSSTNITFESEKTYKLSFYVRTLAIKDKDNAESNNVGAAVKLGDELLFEDINTNGAWVQYSVYVKSSTTQNVARSLQFWLGQGYKGNEADFVSGAAFFDCISLVEADYPNTLTNPDTETKLDFHSDNLILDNAFGTSSSDTTYVKAPSYWTGEYAENHGNPVDGTVFGTIDLNDYANNTEISASNPNLASDTRSGSNVALVIDSKKASHYIVNYTEDLEVYANTSYRLSFWVKTEGIDLSKGLNVELIGEVDGEETVLSTLSGINTQYEDDDDKTDILLNEWKEIVFYVHGHQLDDNAISIRLTLGSGDKYSPDYIKGTVFASNMYYEEITNTEFNSASSSATSAVYTFRTESNATVKNSGFNYIDIDQTVKTDSLVNGKITNSPAVPAYWTGKHVDGLAGEVVSGITNSTTYANLGQTDFPYDSGRLNGYSAYNGEPNLLMIWAKDATAYSYTSENHSLSASTFYKISVNVKTELTSGNAYFTVLSGTNKAFVSDAINSSVSGIATEDNWMTYEFYVKVGLDNATVKFILSLGLDEDNVAEGKVFFDNVNYAQISSDEYADAVESVSLKKISLLTNSFETTAESFPANPSGFNGGAYSGAPSGTENTVAGVVSKNHYDLDEMEAEFDETISNYYKDGKFTGANDTPEFLIIYNKKDTAYRYVSSTNYTFTSSTYYKVSFWAKTLTLNEGDYAYAILELTDTDSLTIKIDSTTAINADATGWAKYSFYVKTADVDVTGISITFGLGEYEKDDTGKVIEDKYATGYAMFDEVTIEDIEQSVYESETESITSDTKNAKVIALKSTTENETGEKEDDTPDATPLSTWEIIGIVSGAMLSIALVAVLVIALIKKISPRIKAKKTKRFKKPTYDKRKSTSATRDKLNKYKD